MIHTPVLLNEVIRFLDPKQGQRFIDCTVGGAGHTQEIAKHTGPKGRILGIDWDPQSVREAKIAVRPLGNRVHIIQGNFAKTQEIAKQEKFPLVHGILFDLGFSSDQLTRGRGFSFLKDEPLDMRYDQGHPLSAQTIVNFWSKKDIERILKEYGEERFAEDIAHAILQERARKHIVKTSQLVRVVESAVPKKYLRENIHPATRTFQALRIAVNSELENIQKGLAGCLPLLAPKGKIAVISFHSLEDRIVKNFFTTQSSLHILTKKPITPSQEEIKANRRSRSAKLRVAQNI